MTHDKVVLAVISDLNRRSEVGIKKYNTTLERTDLELRDWLQHAYEECLDQANYLKRVIMELDGKIAEQQLKIKQMENLKAMLTFKEIQEHFDDTDIQCGDAGSFIYIRLGFEIYLAVNEVDQRTDIILGPSRRTLKGVKTIQDLITLSKFITENEI